MTITPLALVLVIAATPPLRRETKLNFPVDEAFQSDGGVQYFYELAEPNEAPAKDSALSKFRQLDDLSTAGDPYYVMMSRLIYTVDRDISFFTEKRARDATYLRRVAPEMGVRVEPDGSYVVTRTPSNRFKLTWYERPARTEPALERFFEFIPPGAEVASVVVQKNSDFARVMGWRTAERSLTLTAHLPLGPGRTRVVVCTQSLLHHLPPFFLGGKDRIYRESIDGARKLIEQLREYKDQ